MRQRVQQDVAFAGAPARPRQQSAVRLRFQGVRQDVHTLRRTKTSQAHTRRRAQLRVSHLQEALSALRSSQQTSAHTRQIANGNGTVAAGEQN